jgi:hypothetical protein
MDDGGQEQPERNLRRPRLRNRMQSKNEINYPYKLVPSMVPTVREIALLQEQPQFAPHVLTRLNAFPHFFGID